jgi:hypothetical protein
MLDHPKMQFYHKYVYRQEGILKKVKNFLYHIFHRRDRGERRKSNKFMIFIADYARLRPLGTTPWQARLRGKTTPWQADLR